VCRREAAWQRILASFSASQFSCWVGSGTREKWSSKPAVADELGTLASEIIIESGKMFGLLIVAVEGLISVMVRLAQPVPWLMGV
jgi:hypothetical protein